ncbi:MAG TPA: hypothetical protein VLD65_10280 [Anaerolineales bacterium]|nr:hypothetical protein [Anaerolineales bacterium]
MVHALKEAWRVLIPQGTMIDVRPLSVVVPLEVISPEGVNVAGEVDMSPDLKYDSASDQAMDIVLGEGIFNQTSLQTFDYVYYWKTYHGMVVDFNERWQDEIIVSEKTLDSAKSLYQQKYPHARLRLPMQMKLGKFIKN